MKNIKNTYFKAIYLVTSGGNLPEYSDLWRCYHSYASMFDSDYSLFTELRFFNESDSALFSSGCDSSEAVFGVPREGRSGAVQNRPKILYVPVTRKVILTTEKKPPNSPCKVTDTDDSDLFINDPEERKEYEYQRSMSFLYSLMHN